MFLAYEHYYWLYAWIPVFGAFIWFGRSRARQLGRNRLITLSRIGTLWSMLITWLATGKPKYVTQQDSIAYISDIGASYLKPLFIACCCITGVSFFLTLVVERWLRHSGRCVRKVHIPICGLLIVGAGCTRTCVVARKYSPHWP